MAGEFGIGRVEFEPDRVDTSHIRVIQRDRPDIFQAEWRDDLLVLKPNYVPK